jgi:hypothetical protein
MKTHYISCPYFLAGRENVDGMAMRDDINKKIVAMGIAEDYESVRRLLEAYAETADPDVVYHLTIASFESV